MTDEEAAEAFARTKCDCPKSLWDEYYMCTQHKDPIKSFLAGVEHGRHNNEAVWIQGCIDGWTAALDQDSNGRRFKRLEDFFKWKKEQGE